MSVRIFKLQCDPFSSVIKKILHKGPLPNLGPEMAYFILSTKLGTSEVGQRKN
jgi:hypothetical protein